ncbi:MAG: hypothetical protein KC635_12930 [Myxococcales bacterium]|nr:hypothetical protein [Myxococcales bacterium]MCB9736095.1 hypothetical protein [Deltaproteobacteria bacterium]
MKPSDCTLYSGAAAGAEAAFGVAAERHGVAEVNFTFEGHDDARTRGRRVLTPKELERGNVSLAYVGHLMHRVYKDTPLFRRLLASIWHQINSGDEVFCIGWIHDDGTVKGGTGWGAELAKLFGKPLHVYDLTDKKWYWWRDTSWQPDGDPVIQKAAFCGTGTRLIDVDGRDAIDDLFARSFKS